MGFDINEKIITELHYKDVSVITVALSLYIENYERDADKEIIERMKKLINRLGNELYDCPQDEPNGH